jgi:hypothetical protein
LDYDNIVMLADGETPERVVRRPGRISGPWPAPAPAALRCLAVDHGVTLPTHLRTWEIGKDLWVAAAEDGSEDIPDQPTSGGPSSAAARSAPG